MDAAEQLAVDSGPAAVTVRALSEVTSVSNGVIYHAFGSRAGLMGRVWLRAAQRFLTLQREAVDRAPAAGGSHEYAIEAAVAAADAPAEFLVQQPVSGRFLLTVPRRELLGSSEIPDDIAEELRRLDQTLAELFVNLSRAVFDRADREAPWPSSAIAWWNCPQRCCCEAAATPIPQCANASRPRSARSLPNLFPPPLPPSFPPPFPLA